MHSRLFPLLAICLLAATAFAQSEVGGATLNGTITDPSGAAVAGAKVTAVNQDTGLTRETESSAAGLYSMVRLPVGVYDLTVQMQGFRPTKRTAIRLAIGALITLDVKLELGTTQETVTVTAEVPIVESTRSQTSSTVNERAVSDLPINGRNFLDFVLLTPGVHRDPRFGDISFGGQRGTANSLLVDGGDSNNIFFAQSSGRAGAGRNPYSFSQDAVQEFQVNTNGYAAEIGRAGGGVINVITKSGTNNLHGTGFWFYRDRAMNANTFINNSRGIARQPYHFNQFGGNIGGPVKRDKVFFFFDYDGQRNKNPNPVFFTVAPPSDALSQQAARELAPFLTSYTRNFDNNIYTGKVDWIISARNNLSVRYNAHRFTGVNLENSGNASAAEHTGNSNVTTDNIAITHTVTHGANRVSETRIIFLRDDEPGEANSTAPEAVIRQGGVTAMQIGRNFFSPRFTNTFRNQVIHSTTHTRGRHTFKYGFDINSESIDNFFPGNFSGSYTFNSYADFAARRPFSFTQAFAGQNTSGPLTQPNVREYAFFVQDSWRVNDKLTLNYGVRYDLMDSKDPIVSNPDPGLAALSLNTGRMNLDTNNWAGRFGFAYRMDQSGSFVVRGGYGIFYGRTPAIMTGTAHSQNGIQVRTYTLRTDLPTYPNVLSAPPALGVTPDIYVFAPDYVQPQTHQWNLNLEKSLGRDYSITLGYLGVRGVHLSRTRDINLFPAAEVQGRFADGTAVSFFRHPGAAAPDRPNRAFGRVSLFDSGADSIYHGGFVQLNKRYAKNFQVMASYTWSKVIDSVPDQTSVVVGGSDDAKVAQDTLLPNLDRGQGDPDLRHRFVMSGLWDLPYARSLSNRFARAALRDYQVSLITTLESGRWFSALVATDVNNNGNTRADRPPLIGRNTIEGPGLATVDFRFSRDVELYKEKAKLRLIFEAFNLTNRANFNNFNRGQYTFNATTRVFTPTTNFLVRTGSADPRILQLAAKIIF
ncbi:MAG: TonB-dependent receptor [Acidimicrobiia bacterium]|nr:TonB-dependent receptor [Acidimicrobiia bacterium]